MAWHIYDITLDDFQPFTGRGYALARFAVTKDDGVKTWQVRVKARPSLREALGERVAQYDDRDLVGGLGAQTIIVMLQDGIEAFEQDVVLDSAHYPGRPGEPALMTDYRHVRLRVEATPEGEVVPPPDAFAPSEAGQRPHR